MLHHTYVEIKVRKIVGESSQTFGKFCEQVPVSPKKGEMKNILGTSVHELLFAKNLQTVCGLFCEH